MANDCFDAVFGKLDIFLANKFCFGTVGPTIPMPVRDVDLYTSRERLLKSSEWMLNLCKTFEEYDVHELWIFGSYFSCVDINVSFHQPSSIFFLTKILT